MHTEVLCGANGLILRQRLAAVEMAEFYYLVIYSLQDTVNPFTGVKTEEEIN